MPKLSLYLIILCVIRGTKFSQQTDTQDKDCLEKQKNENSGSGADTHEERSVLAIAKEKKTTQLLMLNKAIHWKHFKARAQ